MSYDDELEIANLSRLPRQLALYLANLAFDERAKREALFRSVLAAAQNVGIADLWQQGALSVTYWVLLMSGINQEEEVEIATTLLVWKEFSAKYSAAVRCIPSSERTEFTFCSSRFGAVNCPALIFSNISTMEIYIKIEPQLLLALSTEKGRLQRFLTKVHQLLENGQSLDQIQRVLMTEQFWLGLKFIYKEAKDFVSISIQPG